MKNPTSQSEIDPLEADLAFLEREQREFQNHWIWQKLRCRPEEFFLAFRRHVEALNIPPAQWERAYQKARDEIRIKARERQTSLNPFHMQMLAGLKA